MRCRFADGRAPPYETGVAFTCRCWCAYGYGSAGSRSKLESEDLVTLLAASETEERGSGSPWTALRLHLFAKRFELRTHLRNHRQVLLALVALERLLERRHGLVG